MHVRKRARNLHVKIYDEHQMYMFATYRTSKWFSSFVSSIHLYFYILAYRLLTVQIIQTFLHENKIVVPWNMFVLSKDIQIFLSKVFKIRIVTLLKLVSAIFYQILFFPQMIALQKLWTMFFILSKKLFLFSRYSNFWIFSFPFHNFQTQKDKWKWNNLWCHELACINLQM